MGIGGWIAFGVILYLYLNCGGINIVVPDGPTHETTWQKPPSTGCEKASLVMGDPIMVGKSLFRIPCGDGCKDTYRDYKMINQDVFYHHAIEAEYSPVFMFVAGGWAHNASVMYWYQWPRVALGAGVNVVYVDVPLKKDFGIGPKIGARYSF